MENEEFEVESEDTEDYIDVEDGDEDTTDWKAEALKAQGIAKRLKTKLEKAGKPETKTESKNTGLDYGQKAYLVANGIKGADERALVDEYLASGKELEDIIENKHFQNDLKDLRDERATKEATPSGTKRSNTSARDTVEYWIAKGEMPPVEEVELRRKIVNAKMKSGSNSSPFYNSKR